VSALLDSPHSVVLAQALGPVAQDHLVQARQMQALSFTVHIPLVCFGIAFPVMVLVMEWWGQRTGDPLYRTIARRWSRVMIAPRRAPGLVCRGIGGQPRDGFQATVDKAGGGGHGPE
jgi:hypothetical protein